MTGPDEQGGVVARPPNSWYVNGGGDAGGTTDRLSCLRSRSFAIAIAKARLVPVTWC
jgi:hypothetical protein